MSEIDRDQMSEFQSESTQSFNFLNKEKQKEKDDARRKKRLFQEKEKMKKIQEKNTVEAPKNILYKCFPDIAYK